MGIGGYNQVIVILLDPISQCHVKFQVCYVLGKVNMSTTLTIRFK